MSDVSLNLLVLKTHDVQRLRSFYESIGISFKEEQHGPGPLHFAGQMGQVVIEIYPLAADRPVDDSTRLGFRIRDPDRVVEAVPSAGGRVVTAPRETEWGYAAIVADPDGRRVELVRG